MLVEVVSVVVVVVGVVVVDLRGAEKIMIGAEVGGVLLVANGSKGVTKLVSRTEARGAQIGAH